MLSFGNPTNNQNDNQNNKDEEYEDNKDIKSNNYLNLRQMRWKWNQRKYK